MDMVEPLPTTGALNQFILIIVDYATRWLEAFPLRLTHSETVQINFPPPSPHML